MMKPTRGNANPPDQPAENTPCGCSGECGLHTGPCPARHLHRYPATRTTVHLKATEHGPRCPFCLLATTHPNTASAQTTAALRRPSAQGEQGGLFDAAPWQRAW